MRHLAPCPIGLVAVILATLPAVPAAVAEVASVAHGYGGAVASAEPASTAVGLEILARGGNAADTAVATALAMAVVHPQAGNLGGGGFAVVRFARKTESLDFRETAPARAKRDMYLDADGNPRPGASTVGPLAAGVPGSIAGLEALHRRYGRLAWPEVVEPARRLAAEGFTVSPRLEKDLEQQRDLLSRFPETAEVWLPDGKPPAAGDRMKLPALGRTLGIYARKGAVGLQTGEVASRVVDSAQKYSGVLTLDDLAGYRPQWRRPLEFTSFGWKLAAMDLPSSGGYLLAATLLLADRTGWPNEVGLGHMRSHLLIEIWRRAFADRAQLGDPDFTRVESGTLLRIRRLKGLAASIDRRRATESSEIGDWRRVMSTTGSAERSETVHLSVVDGDGNVVALSTTLNGIFGCGLWVPSVGIFLNNEMDDFTTAPGRPNMFGLIQGAANEVAPGRRMLSSMVPVVAWKEDDIIALGGRGGSRIPTAVAQVLLDVLVDDEDLPSAIARPRIHHQWLPDEVWMEEDALSRETVQALESLGHRIVTSTRDAKVNAVRRRPDGSVAAVGDPRGPASGGVSHREPPRPDLNGDETRR